MMNSTEQAVDFLGYRITGVQDEDGTLYVPLNELHELLEIALNGEMLLPEPASTQKFLSAADVGKMLGISAKAVNELASEGKRGCVQVTANRRLFTKKLVEEFVKAVTVRRDCVWDECAGY